MKVMKWLGLPLAVCLLVLSLVACDRLATKVENLAAAGTTLGYSRCINNNRGQGLSQNLVTILCQREHVRTISAQVHGKAGYEPTLTDAMSFGGWIENKSADYVITGITLSISHEDNVDKDGKLIKEILRVDDMWVEPGTMTHLNVTDIKFHPKKDRLRVGEKTLYSWMIDEVRGLQIRLQ